MKNYILDSFKAEDLRNFVNNAAVVIKKQDNAKKRKWLAEYNVKYASYRYEQETYISWKNVKYCSNVDDAKQMYGRKWKIVVKNLYDLAMYCKDYTDCQETIGKVVALPQTCYELLKLFGTHRNVGKVINKAKECGLLREILGNNSTNYVVGVVSKKYWFNDKKFNELCMLQSYIDNDTLLKNPVVTQQSLSYSGTIRLISKFEPSITRSKTGIITKIGIRSYNEVCGMPKKNALYTREDFFKELYGTKDVNEFDVKSSIYRVTYFLNTGEWLSNDVDFYQLMCPYTFDNDAERENYKSLCMRLYFGKSADDVYTKLINNVIEDSEKNRYFTEVLFDNMRQVIGQTYGSEIFLHESCIYMLLMNKLLNKGFLVTQVYDGFYCNDEIEQICLEILPECANEYIKIAQIQIKERKDKPVYVLKGDNGCREFVNSVAKDCNFSERI